MTRKPPAVEASPEQAVDYLLRGTDSTHVVVGPHVWQPSDGTTSRVWYFIVATSELGRGFRCDQVMERSGDERLRLIRELARRSPAVVHDVDTELRMIRLCAMLWPGEQVERLRAMLEADALR